MSTDDWELLPFVPTKLSPAGKQEGMSRRTLAIGLFALAILVLTLLSPLLLPASSRFNDFDVFRLGGVTVFHGHLYDARTAAGYPFTYPPFAAILFWPLSLITRDAGLTLWLMLTAIALVLGAFSLLPKGNLTFVGIAVVVACATVPIRNDIRFAQIEVVLAALVLLDLLVVPEGWRGMLVGLATAIKLTPGLFIAYLIVTRQWSAAIRSAAVAVGAELLGFAIAPHESWTYWTQALFSLSRFGVINSVGNQSATGVFIRLGLTGRSLHAIAAVVSVIVVAIALWRARAAYQNEERTAATAIIGCATLVASPLSWTHHFTWLLVALAALTIGHARSWDAPTLVSATLLLVVICVSPLLHVDSFFIASVAVCLTLPTSSTGSGIGTAHDQPQLARR